MSENTRQKTFAKFFDEVKGCSRRNILDSHNICLYYAADNGKFYGWISKFPAQKT